MSVTFFIILFMLMPGLANQGLNPAAPDKDDTASPQIENEDIRQLCYAARTKAAYDPTGTHYNYEFIRFWIEGEEVRGTWQHFPYGTDRMEASLTGVYREETGEIHTQAEMYGEGMLYQQTRSFKLKDGALQLDYKDQHQKPGNDTGQKEGIDPGFGDDPEENQRQAGGKEQSQASR